MVQITDCEITREKSMKECEACNGKGDRHNLNCLRMGAVNALQRMGKELKCKTCSKDYNECPGHFGFVKIPDSLQVFRDKTNIDSFCKRWYTCCGSFDCECEKENKSHYQTMNAGVSVKNGSDEMSPYEFVEAIRSNEDVRQYFGVDSVTALQNYLLCDRVYVLPNMFRHRVSGTCEGSSDFNYSRIIRMCTESVPSHDCSAARRKIHNEITEFQRKIIGKVSQKDGRVWKHLNGQRLDQCARSVITANPCLKLDYVALPVHLLLCVDEDTMNEEECRKWNEAAQCESLSQNYELFLSNQRSRNQCLKCCTCDGRCEYVDFRRTKVIREGGKPLAFIPQVRCFVGDSVIQRRIRNNDHVILNRQPSLWRGSVALMKVVLSRHAKSISFHPSLCSRFNADFDGDEMNVFVVNPKLAIDCCHMTPSQSMVIDNSVAIPLWQDDLSMLHVFVSQKKKEVLFVVFEHEESFFYQIVKGCLQPYRGVIKHEVTNGRRKQLSVEYGIAELQNAHFSPHFVGVWVEKTLVYHHHGPSFSSDDFAKMKSAVAKHHVDFMQMCCAAGVGFPDFIESPLDIISACLPVNIDDFVLHDVSGRVVCRVIDGRFTEIEVSKTTFGPSHVKSNVIGHIWLKCGARAAAQFVERLSAMMRQFAETHSMTCGLLRFKNEKTDDCVTVERSGFSERAVKEERKRCEKAVVEKIQELSSHDSTALGLLTMSKSGSKGGPKNHVAMFGDSRYIITDDVTGRGLKATGRGFYDEPRTNGNDIMIGMEKHDKHLIAPRVDGLIEDCLTKGHSPRGMFKAAQAGRISEIRKAMETPDEGTLSRSFFRVLTDVLALSISEDRTFLVQYGRQIVSCQQEVPNCGEGGGFRSKTVHSHDAVGGWAASSLGAARTQATLSSFHQSGQHEAQVVDFTEMCKDPSLFLSSTKPKREVVWRIKEGKVECSWPLVVQCVYGIASVRQQFTHDSKWDWRVFVNTMCCRGRIAAVQSSTLHRLSNRDNAMRVAWAEMKRTKGPIYGLKMGQSVNESVMLNQLPRVGSGVASLRYKLGKNNNEFEFPSEDDDDRDDDDDRESAQFSPQPSDDEGGDGGSIAQFSPFTALHQSDGEADDDFMDIDPPSSPVQQYSSHRCEYESFGRG